MMRKSRAGKRNKGTTLVEMLVCFALLGIFMSAAAVVIGNVTTVFFDVKGQSYGRQVADILLGKITGEIEGAKISATENFGQPIIYQDPAEKELGNVSGYKIDLYDRTDTHIQIYAEDGALKIKYFEINPPKDKMSPEYIAGHRDEIIWTFDEGVYQGYKITSLRFVPANKGRGGSEMSDSTLEDSAYEYTYQENDYPGNVVGVYLTLESPQYGEFYAYRYIKMYNLSDEDAKDYNIRTLVSTN